ncbi:MAG: phosphoribosylamine--glycine ligase [Oscillospiraceae bacterium]|nr:phosphoribosylamine--glycine ligase [Oscillospiraceae bacterium]
MKVLVVGSGGREHAICLALSKSPRISKLYCAPGNGGIAKIAECVNISATDIDAMVKFAKTNADFVMVAPDDPLALGMVDALEAVGVRAFGPSKNAAKLESSKAFAKGIMKKYNIPTAAYEAFTSPDAAKAYIKKQGAPIVVKADGLALGKGVVVAMDEQTALNAVDLMMCDRKFGDSGNKVIIEEYMTGPEVTILAFTDGKTVVPMHSSQDHKRAFTGDLGPNTGGMGAFCPSPLYTPEIADICMKEIFRPTIDAMNKEGTPFKGVIYFGLMLTPSGPRVIEYNARFGDPETQPILMQLETDLLDIFEAVTDERLDKLQIKWHDGYACCVVVASGGYPDKYETGFKISGLDKIPDDIFVFHAGTKLSGEDLVTNGGRVLGITARGSTLEEAALRAYRGVNCVSFKNAYFRTDIGR